jgi:hypothetical protein
MTTLREAAQQALEALEYYEHRKLDWCYADEAAITDLRAALKQPGQEPDRWGAGYEAGYAAGMAEMKPEQAEPVAYLYHDASTPHHAHPWLHSTMLVLAADRRPSLRGETPLFTHPPRREWRGLTDTERAAVQHESFKRGLSPLEFMELHEAALRSKNHD